MHLLPALYFFLILLVPAVSEAGALVLALVGAWHLLPRQRARALAAGVPGWSRTDSTVALAFMAIFLFKLTSMLWAEQPRLALSNALWHLHFLFWPLVFWGIQACRPTSRQVEHGVAAGLVVTAAWFIGFALTRTWDMAHPFEAGTQSTGLLGQLTLALGTWNFLVLTRPQAQLAGQPRWPYALAWVCTFIVLYGSNRRIELASFLVVVVLVTLFRVRRHLNLLRTLGLLLAAAALIALVAYVRKDRFLQAFQEVYDYFAEREHNPAVVLTSLGARMEMYRVALLSIMDHPWLGISAGARPYLLHQYGVPGQDVFGHRHFHSEFLQALVEGGVVWFTLLGAAVVHAVRKLVIEPFRAAPEAALMAAGLLLAYVLEGLFSAALTYGPANGLFVVASAWAWQQVRAVHRH